MEGDGEAQNNNFVLTINGFFSSYTVKGQFNKVSTHFVVDTGATTTLIRKDAWCRAGGSSGKLKQMPKLRLVAGHPLEVLGAASYSIQLGGHMFSADVIVMDALTEEGWIFWRHTTALYKLDRSVLP